MKMVIANFKMHKELDEIKEYINYIKGKISNNLEVVLCPSDIYLNLFKSDEYHLGAQNCYYGKEGKYTGEVSPFQLKSVGAEYIIVGHSARREYFKETDEIIAKKINEIMKNNLKAIFCIGEDKTDKDMHKTSTVIKRQILNALKDVDEDMIQDIVIAYEPVYAIGTGLVPESKDIEEVTKYIKSIITEKYNTSVKVLYGGSVDENNVQEIIDIDGVDGVLIGSACLNPGKFIEILNKID